MVAKRVVYPLVVDDLYDGGQLALEHAAVDQDDAAELDLAPDGRDDVDVAHCSGGVVRGEERREVANQRAALVPFEV